MAEKWNPPKSKSKREKMPQSQFLLPSKRKFPFKKKVNGKWKVSCQGLRQAMRRQAQHGYQNIYRKAKALLNKNCKK